MQKARRHRTSLLRPLVSVWFQVLLHSLAQGSFHLSLTVLVHYRSLGSIQPWMMVHPYSNRISRVPPYLIPLYTFQIQDCHLLRCSFPTTSSTYIALGQSLFARRYSGNLIDFSSYGYLDVSVPRVCVLTTILQIARLPHSDIHGSIRICQSP